MHGFPVSIPAAVSVAAVYVPSADHLRVLIEAATITGQLVRSREETCKAMVRLGRILIDVRPSVPHGQWQALLGRHNIHIRTAQRAVEVIEGAQRFGINPEHYTNFRALRTAVRQAEAAAARRSKNDNCAHLALVGDGSGENDNRAHLTGTAARDARVYGAGVNATTVRISDDEDDEDEDEEWLTREELDELERQEQEGEREARLGGGLTEAEHGGSRVGVQPGVSDVAADDQYQAARAGDGAGVGGAVDQRRVEPDADARDHDGADHGARGVGVGILAGVVRAADADAAVRTDAGAVDDRPRGEPAGRADVRAGRVGAAVSGAVTGSRQMTLASLYQEAEAARAELGTLDLRRLSGEQLAAFMRTVREAVAIVRGVGGGEGGGG